MIKLTKIKLFIATLLLCVTLSCEKELDFQLTNQVPKIVMYAFPMPDSILKIHASYTTNILSTKNFEGIKGLKYNTLVNGITGAYGVYPFNQTWLKLMDVTGKSNHSYRLNYELEDGTVIYGNTSIPSPINIIDVDTSSVSYANQEGVKEKMLRCIIEINDPINTKNYYQLKVDYQTIINEESGDKNIESINFIKEDKVFLIRDDESVLLTDVDFQGTFTDHLFNGKNYKVKLLLPLNEYKNDALDSTNKLNIQLFTLTPEYYMFIRSSIEEEAFRDYPIFEPVNLFTNITNGIGVVAGLSVDEYYISLN